MLLVICEEMQKLRDWLDDEGIEWYDDSAESEMFWMARTKFAVNTTTFSVINGVGSYGGCMSWDSDNQGFLECMINGNEPYGYLTAEDVEELIEEVRHTGDETL